MSNNNTGVRPMIEYTQGILSEMSDFEVNKAVALKLGLLVQVEFTENLGFTEKYHEQYPNTVWVAQADGHGKQSAAWDQVCYTRDWADAGPIAEKHRIDVVALKASSPIWMASKLNVFTKNKSPTRAICECFLMMENAA